MASTTLLDGNHWRERAREMRALVVDITDPKLKHRMLKIAASYDKLAERADERTAQNGDKAQ